MILEPLVEVSSMIDTVELHETSGRHWLFKMNNQNLPLIYVECQGVRVIMPSAELGGTEAAQDVCMFQVDTVNLMPSAENPICRTPCRPDIYQLAAQSRILHIPGISPFFSCLYILSTHKHFVLGSEVEDRQYQLDITGLSVNTGTWEELDPILNQRGASFSTLRTMSENPALEWNNLERAPFRSGSIDPHLSFWPVISR